MGWNTFFRTHRSAAALALVLGASLYISDASAHAADRQEKPTLVSQYVEGADGTLLAVDVWLPPSTDTRRNLPAVIEFTRYWRSRQTPDSEASPTIRHFVRGGYAYMVVDARGTGASFGSRSTEFSPDEVRDMGAVIAWTARQPWSNGRVATLGTSYAGNTAELAAMTGRPELRAVVPRFSDFSAYHHAVRPGGLRNRVIADAWIAYTRALDANRLCNPEMGKPCDTKVPRLRPVDGDVDGVRLSAAIAAHGENADLTEDVNALVYADDRFGGTDGQAHTLDSVSPSQLWRAIDNANVPAFHWASWFDGGTAEGVLTRFKNYRSPMRVIIGPWTHGGGLQAVTDDIVAAQNLATGTSRVRSDRESDRFAGARLFTGMNEQLRKSTNPPEARPSPSQQLEMIQNFLDPLMKADSPIPPTVLKEIQYYTLGRETWNTTNVWPPAHVTPTTYYFQDEGGLTPSRPKTATGSDVYRGDATATSGTKNRWHTQLGAPIVYSDRKAAKAITYTTPSFPRVVELTGSPSIQIELASDQTSGALFAYLEHIHPDGRVTYLTDGQIDLKFNGPAPELKDFSPLGPTHRFLRKDARSFKAGEPITLSFSLLPVSAQLEQGSRLRISLATADADTFDVPSDAQHPPTLTIFRQDGRASSIRLPLAYH